MNPANDSPDYLKSNNRYVSWNKQVPSPQGAWRHWIIIRPRDRSETLIFVDLPVGVLSQHPFPICRGALLLLSACSFGWRIFHCSWWKLPPGVTVRVPFPQMWGSWDPHLAAFLAEWCFHWSLNPLRLEAGAYYYHPSMALSLKESRCEGTGIVLGRWCVKSHLVLGKHYGISSKIKQNYHMT